MAKTVEMHHHLPPEPVGANIFNTGFRVFLHDELAILKVYLLRGESCRGQNVVLAQIRQQQIELSCSVGATIFGMRF